MKNCFPCDLTDNTVHNGAILGVPDGPDSSCFARESQSEWAEVADTIVGESI